MNASASPRRAFRRTVALVLLVAFAFGSLRAEETDLPTLRRFLNRAEQAEQTGDTAALLANLHAAAARRPDHIRTLLRLAAAQTAHEPPANAVATLQQLARLGIHLSVDSRPEFAPLRARDDFQALVADLKRNLAPQGESSVAFVLPHLTGVIEGIAWREKTGAFYFGDVRERCVWRRQPSGEVVRFTPEDVPLAGVFRLVVDESHRALWAALNTVPQTKSVPDTPTIVAALAELDLESGAVRRILHLPADDQKHLLGDFARAPDGTLYATDTFAPLIWRFVPGASTAEMFLRSDNWVSLQGITLNTTTDALFISDYGDGLSRIDLATRRVQRFEPPAETTLLGCDTLLRTPDGALIAVQNGTQPQRILRLTLAADEQSLTRVEVLAANPAAISDATLGCIVGDDFVFVADGGWERPEQPTLADVPRDVPVRKVRWRLPAH